MGEETTGEGAAGERREKKASGSGTEREEGNPPPRTREASYPSTPAMTDTNKRSGDFAQAPPATTTTTTTLSSTSRSFTAEIEVGRIGGFAEAAEGPPPPWVEPGG